MRALALLLVVTASAMAQSLPPSPWNVSGLSVIRSPKGAEQVVSAPMRRLVKAAVLPAGNLLPTAVITISENTLPELQSYAKEVGLNKPVHVTIKLEDPDRISLTVNVKAGFVYQPQFMLSTLPGQWCCAFNDYIPAVDGVKVWFYPTFASSEPWRLYRIMSNE